MSSDSPAAIIFDELGNPVGVMFDGYVYRLQVEAKDQPTSAANRTVANASTVDTLLLPENPFRLNAFIYNASDSPMYIGFGTTPVSATSYSLQLGSQESMEIPSNFIGEVHGSWISNTPTGMAFMTEMTP